MEAVQFAHPVERELANLFDAHGIEWQYEPHTFVLQQDRDGTVREAFTPDFYLPGLDVYVECTVMRQELTRRKRRKVRHARERSGIAVEVLFLRDLRRLARRWNLVELDRAIVSARGQQGLNGCATGNRCSATMRDATAGTVSDGVFRIEVERPSEATAMLVLHGEADLHSAPELRGRLRATIDGGATNIILDFSDSAFVDSTSLGVLLGGMKRLREQDGQIHLVVPRPDIRRIFEITLLDRVFPLHETREQALAAVSAGG